jgi:Mn-dependent DtxR family transcriptional regulator
MPQDSETNTRSADIIVEAGEILQKLTPARLATLLFVSNDEIETQSEIADILDVSSSTITTYLQTFAKLSMPLAARENQYTITSRGSSVIGFIARMSNRLGEGWRDIDWENEDEREQIGEFLSPLNATQTMTPFFILYSLGQRSTVDGQIGIFAPSQAVPVRDIVSDVEKWQEERGKTATRKQVRSVLGRFEDFGVVEIDGEEVALEEKGKEQAKLLEQLIELIEKPRDTEAPSATQQDCPPMDTQPTTATATGDHSPQLGLEEFYEGEEIDTADNPTIVPAYGVSSPNEQSSLVLPLTPTMTAEELDNQTARIRREYGDNAQLELFWTALSSESEETDTDRNDDRSNERPQPQ